MLYLRIKYWFNSDELSLTNRFFDGRLGQSEAIRVELTRAAFKVFRKHLWAFMITI